jgi:hypothetical protein
MESLKPNSSTSATSICCPEPRNDFPCPCHHRSPCTADCRLAAHPLDLRQPGTSSGPGVAALRRRHGAARRGARPRSPRVPRLRPRLARTDHDHRSRRSAYSRNDDCWVSVGRRHVTEAPRRAPCRRPCSHLTLPQAGGSHIDGHQSLSCREPPEMGDGEREAMDVEQLMTGGTVLPITRWGEPVMHAPTGRSPSSTTAGTARARHVRDDARFPGRGPRGDPGRPRHRDVRVQLSRRR